MITWLECSPISIFQAGGLCHFGFLKFQIFDCRTRHKDRTASLCQIFVEIRGRYIVIFRFFKTAAAAIVDFFLIFEVLTIATLKRAKLNHHVKCRRNLSNRGQNMAIFPFSKMAAGRRHLGFFSKFQIFNDMRLRQG